MSKKPHAEAGDDSGSSEVREISIFQENFEYWRSQGESVIVARNKAIDYYRKFTKREVTDNWETFQGTIEDENHIAPLELISFNQTVSKLIEAATVKDRKFLFLIIKQHDLDQYLNPENEALCDFYTGDKRPEKMFEVAGMMGFSCQASGSSISANNHKKILQSLVKELGLV